VPHLSRRLLRKVGTTNACSVGFDVDAALDLARVERTRLLAALDVECVAPVLLPAAFDSITTASGNLEERPFSGLPAFAEAPSEAEGKTEWVA
jgi:hypothetical protein